MSPPAEVTLTAAPAGSCAAAKERDSLIVAAQTILTNCGIAIGPRKVNRLVQTFQARVERNGFAFFDFLATSVQLDAAARRRALADPDIQRVISYADPTGETAHPTMPDLVVSPGCSENAARQILRGVKRGLGCADEVAKRNPAQIKERQAADREKAAAEVARLHLERDDLIASRSRLLAGRANGLTRQQVRAIEKRIEETERERRHWESLMTSVPASADHRGSGLARHRSGDR